MAKMVWTAPNLAYSATFSGGGWRAGDLSLDALLDPVLGHVARSVDADPANTQFIIDLGRAEEVGGLHLLGHNGSTRGRAIIDGSRFPDFREVHWNAEAVAIDFFPRLFRTRDLPWSHSNWFSGKPTARQIGRTTAQLVHLFPRNKALRYWRVRCIDPLNPDGFFQLGKVMIGPRFDFPFNYSIGGNLTIVDDSVVTRSLSGTPYFDERGKRRRMAFNFAYLKGQDQFARHFDLLADLGTTREFMLIENPDDSRNLQRSSFCAHLTQPSPLELLELRYISATHVAEEII